jgi:hypothetical protein
MDYTTDELKAFPSETDITLTSYNKSSSVKTNIYIFAKNFATLVTYITKLKAYVVYVASLIDVDSLITTILAKYASAKNVLTISPTLTLNSSNTQTVNSVTYKVARTGTYIVEITNNTDASWVVDNLIVQVKNVDGTIVYPTVLTINNKITINFIDSLSVEYRVFFM